MIWVSVIFFTRDRIALAIGLIRESAEALISMPILCVSPVLQTMLFAGFSCLWMYYCVYLVSSGDINTHVDDTTGLTFKTVDFDKNTQHAIVFMVFGWFWSVGFIEAMGQIITSHSVVSWYFADRRQIIDSNQVLYSTVFCARYHCGTAAMGSLVIAIIRMIRMTLEYIKMRLAYNSNSKIAKYVACYLSCIMNIFEKGIKFLNKHAYVQCAIFGTPFFTSAGRAYFLLVRNFGRLAAVTVVGDFVILVGKLSISLLCAGVGYLYMKTYMRRELNGFVLPTLFIAFIAFYTATMFLGVLSATADTLLQACIVDEEMSIGKAESESNSLRELIGIREGRWKDTFSFASQDGERPSEYDDYENGQDYSLASFDPHVDDSASSSKSFYSGKIEQSALNFFNSSKVPSKKVQRQNFANSLELNTLQQYRSRKNNDDAASTISSLSTNTNTRSVFGFNLGGGTKQLKRSSSDDALNDDMSIDNIYFHNASTDIIGMATSRREENRHATHRRSTSGGSNIFPDNTSENGSFFNEVQQQNRLLKGTLRQSSSFYLDAGRSQLNRSSSSGFTDSPRNASPRNVLTIDVRKGMGSPNGSGGSSFEASSPLAPHTANTIREPASRMMSQMNQISGPTQTNPLTFSMANPFSRPSSTWTLEQSSDPCSVERNRNKSDGKKLNEVQAAEPTTTHPPSNTAAIFYSNPFDEDKI